MEYKISGRGWNAQLSNAINSWTPGDTIIVHSEIQKDLGLRAARNRGMTDVEIIVSDELSEA
jgi:hypothetical protein